MNYEKKIREFVLLEKSTPRKSLSLTFFKILYFSLKGFVSMSGIIIFY